MSGGNNLFSDDSKATIASIESVADALTEICALLVEIRDKAEEQKIELVEIKALLEEIRDQP